MTPEPQDDSKITLKAAEWFQVLRSAGTEEHEAFGAWLRESPKHVEEFMMVSAAYRQLDGAELENLGSLETAAASANILPLHKQTSRRAPVAPPANRKRRLAIAAGIGAIAIACGVLMKGDFTERRVYSTAVGEIRSLELPDGSVLQLNTHSQVKVRFSAGARDIDLLSGEALFKVAHHPSRPFRVHAGTATIQAIGTQFNVYRRAQGTTVSVLEGSVRVSGDAKSKTPAPTLSAGQKVSVAADGRVEAVASADAEKAVAWQQRRLIFRGEPLSEVAEQFNRYNKTPQLQVQGAAAGAKQIAGIFDADDPESLLLFLAKVPGVEVELRGQVALIVDHR